MYTIGEISKIVNISTNALRYYDEIGLLRPVAVKNDNQYRYYSDEQIRDIMFIMELKQYGFSLGEIKELINNRENKKLKEKLQQKLIKVNEDIVKLKQNSKILERRISELIKEELEMKGGRILIVDDLELVRKMIKSIIEEHGYICAGEACNGEEAIEAYEKLKPDLVIMDITMPRMDGIDATRDIIAKHKDAKIVMCSAMSYPKIIFESLVIGARDFVTKPISSLRLIEAIERAMNNKPSVNKGYIKQISLKVKENFSKSPCDILLEQEGVDFVLNEFLHKEKSIEGISDYIKSLNSKQKENLDILHRYRYEKLEDRMITSLKDKFGGASKVFEKCLSNKFGEEYLIELLTVESITLNEYKTLLRNNSNLGEISYKDSELPVYVNVYGKIQNDIGILKEIINIIKHKIEIESINEDSLIICSEKIITQSEDYASVLVSFSIEVSEENKGFIAVSLPLSLL